MPETVVVIPCYNEARRLDPEAFVALVEASEVDVLFVDDGSTDETAALLASIAARAPGGRVAFTSLERNQGKAEAVRQGLLRGLAVGAAIVGFADADLSTPVDEILRVRRALDGDQEPQPMVAMGARVLLSGRHIERRPQRHYLGRLFSTMASLILQAPIYDTQCETKFFRDTDALRLALGERFLSRWAFDVELLGRLLAGGPGTAALLPEQLVEVPLRRWEDVGGSKLKPRDMVKAALDLVGIQRDLQARRRRARRAG